MDSLRIAQLENSISELVHELSQPLSNIALSASFLDLLLDSNSGRAREQALMIQKEVARAARILNDAAAGLRRSAPQRELEPPASFDVTNPETAAVR